MNKLIPIFLVLMISQTSVFGQSDHYDNAGKIYTVVAVVCITIIGIAAMLFYLERRIKSIEEQIEEQTNHE